MQPMPRLQAKSFDRPDEVHAMPGMQVEMVGLDDLTVGHCTFQPGWNWSRDMAPQLGGGTSCQMRHVGYTVSGTLHVVMDDGQTMDIPPGAAFEIPPGHDKWVVGDESWECIEWGATPRAMQTALEDSGQRALATVMFTDIVDSTQTLERIGDQAWQALLLAHNARLRQELNVFRGREIKTTGDGFLAIFDSATRAVRCAAAMTRAARALDLPIRVGVHTGEVEFAGDDARGIAVHTAARMLSLGGADDVIISSTTRDLLEGSGLVLEDAGEHELKGLPGVRRVFRLAAAS